MYVCMYVISGCASLSLIRRWLRRVLQEQEQPQPQHQISFESMQVMKAVLGSDAYMLVCIALECFHLARVRAIFKNSFRV